MDEVLINSSKQYQYNQIQYEKILMQRNKLLQQISIKEASEQQLDLWDLQLAKFGSLVTTARASLFSYLNERFSEVITKLSPGLKQCRFLYKNSAEAEDQQFLEKLQSIRAKEREAVTTLLGPHRDDFQTLWQDQNLVGFLSRGQLRSITLCLKILEKHFLETVAASKPLLLLDDVFSEFDPAHQVKLGEFMQSFGQVFLTTAHLGEVKKYLPASSQIFQVENGEVVKRTEVWNNHKNPV